MKKLLLNSKSSILLFFFLAIVSCGPKSSIGPGSLFKKHKFDVVVYGGTAGGVAAAVAATREKARVVLIEPGKYLGGLVSGGLGGTDVGKSSIIGGISREFFKRVGAYYGKSLSWRLEPHIATRVFDDLYKESRLRVYFENRLESVQKENGRIVSLKTETGHRFEAKVFIDASYEGDLMAKSGVSYAVGREGRKQYDESYAGVLKKGMRDQFDVNISAFDKFGKVIPGVVAGMPGKEGQGDNKISAYNIRLCLTKKGGNKVEIEPPANYDPMLYELHARYLAKKPGMKMDNFFTILEIPNHKIDLNNRGPVSSDFIGANWEYPDGDYETRSRIWEAHENYTRGLFHFLKTDSRVPKPLQTEVKQWGLCKDEFKDNNHWPHALYVREARRMLGEYVMTEHDVRLLRAKYDSIGLGTSVIEAHHVQRHVTPEGFVRNEGFIYPKFEGKRTYQLPYRMIIPKKEECENLLVPVAFSASHIAYSAIRMEPVYMILGQSAGVAAAMAVEDEVGVQEVSWRKLQARLVQLKQRIKGKI